ncbi:MAG: NDP-sugar synthase [Actinobacteria bacterium]|nr:NDP-sugar synthase [Actinomycetota bacterium]MCL6095842.1 NDP-sugar synthase [Actinomycetota bacterium]
MKAVVLVGGEGTRLRPLTLSTPKQMLPIVDLPMIVRVINHLATYGIEEIILSLGYRPEAFVSLLPEGRHGSFTIKHAVETEPLGTAGAIRFAADKGGIDTTFVAVNGDVLSDLDISKLIEFHIAHKAQATLSLTPVDDPSAYGVVVTDSNSQVLSFIEKPSRETASSNWINAGTYVLEPEVLERIQPGRAVSIEREIFPAVVNEGGLYAFPSDAYWLDTGTPSCLLRANMDLIDGTRGGPPHPNAREHSPGIWLHGSSIIKGELIPPCFVGDGAVVEKGAILERSVVGRGVHVQQNVKASNCVLLEKSSIGEGTSIRDSIIGERAFLGAGSVISGLSVVGCDAILEPGTHLQSGRVP